MVGGRKMGLVYYHVEEKENLMKTGTVKNTLEKPFGSSNSNTNGKDASSTIMNTRPVPTRQDRESSFQQEKPIKTKFFNAYHISKSSSLNKQDPLEAATQDIFNMMNKDYHPKGRRKPPVNNHLPIRKP
ncbi:Ribonuclease H-like protein [Dioscorea alata]|uniref:Ribonuclease H-like protein n=1 Tax=Dioscorea alata TaxID=55571 RepID=A0ACB7WM14_DIOAL|nr:Ribonuclease H-like protein [Dioscorea alata]